MNSKYTLIAFATAWGSRFGGINAFNIDLLKAVAAAYWESVHVVCVVADCSQEDIKTASEQFQVQLVQLGLPSGKIGAEHEALAWAELQKIGQSTQPEQTIWLGHDLITGAIANKSAQERGGRAALIHHMSYAHYESFAESSASAYIKEQEQKALFCAANLRLAVGPLLRDALAEFIDQPTTQIPMLIPGLAVISPKQHPGHSFTAFVSGRLDAGAQKIKQAHLGVAGFAYAVWRCDADSGLPEALKGEREPKLKLRGVDFEQTLDAAPSQAEAELKQFAEIHATRAINLQALPFTQDRTELFDELKAASVCLMPSWHEGFGLVAWEAIAAGVPLILSKKSGVYRFLKEQGKEHLACSMDVQGKSDAPYFTDKDRGDLAQLLIQIAKDQRAYRAKAHTLREELLAKFHWRACADQLITSFGWQAPQNLLPQEKNPAPIVETIAAPTPQPRRDPLLSWLKLPTPVWHHNAGLSPSQLLKAEEALVPFDPRREPFLLTQLTWVTGTDYPVGVRLLTGEGGTGKTRLALEMCQRLSIDGWRTGFLSADLQKSTAEQLAKTLMQSQQPLLLVLDYAETRTSELIALLEALLSPSTQGQKIRLLLLARSSGEWWGRLPAENGKCEALLDGAATTGPYPVPALYDELPAREQAFTGAMTAFAKALGCAAPPIQPDLNAAQYRVPLYLQMAALLTLLGEHTPSAEALPQTLVRHEQRYWYKFATEIGTNATVHEAGNEADLLMSLVTLIGHAPTPKSIEKIWHEAGGAKQQLKPLFNRLSPLYPDQQGLGGLRPDLLGEALVSRFVLGLQGDQLLGAVLGLEAEPAQRKHALTVLARALRYRSELSDPITKVLTQQFARCAQEIVAVCIQTPSPLSRLAELSFQSLRPAQALQVAGTLVGNFENEILPLGGLELLIRETLHRQALSRSTKGKASPDHRSTLAHACSTLSIAHYQVGRTQDALAYSKQALDIYERLVKDKPERFEPDWATSLNNYANRLADLGYDKQALECAKQALDIYERLAKDKPERFEPDWATSLNNYAIRLADSGDDKQALVYAEQALDIYERLAKDKPERFEPDWARSLGNYAIRLADSGDDKQALECTKRALGIYEKLSKDRSKKFLSDLQETQLGLALFNWLASDACLELPGYVQHDGSSTCAMRSVEFFHFVLASFANFKTSQSAEALASAWTVWETMSQGEKRRHENIFLLGCAYAEANELLPESLRTWRLQLEALRTRRNGRLPIWMQQVAAKKGFSLAQQEKILPEPCATSVCS
jgi:Glycosyl transferases group 1/Tetratricopeptide repeat